MANGKPPSKRKPAVGTVDKIKAQNALKELPLEVPEWGCTVKLREFSKAAWRQLREDARNGDGTIDEDRVERLMLVRGVIDPAFTEEDVAELWEGSSEGVDRVLAGLFDLNGLTAEVMAQAARLFRAAS